MRAWEGLSARAKRAWVKEGNGTDAALGKPYKSKNARTLFRCLLIAFPILLICSQCSFLYPINTLLDVNIFFTMGRGMMAGKTVYACLYDQKGPLLYFIFGLGSLLSDSSFHGVFLIEWLSYGVFLYLINRIQRLYTGRDALAVTAFIGLAIASSEAFSKGGNAEEFCLPLLAYALYASVEYFKQQYPARISLRTVLVCGVLAGCVLWIKFTILGLFAAWIFMVFLSALLRRDVRHAFACCGVFLGGMLLATVPWLLYFSVNGALSALWKYYFYNNIFLYSGAQAAMTVWTILYRILSHLLTTMLDNPAYWLLILLGGGYLVLSCRSGETRLARCNLVVLASACTAGIFCGMHCFPYYGLVLAVFAALGAVPLLRLYDGCVRRFGSRRALVATALGMTLSCALLLRAAHAPTALGTRREDYPQYQLAALIPENASNASPTLLCYGFMDRGYYLAAGCLPVNRYFTELLVPLPEIRQEQEEIVKNARVEFVVTLPHMEMPDCYRLIGEAADWDGVFRLYQRRD